MANEAIKEKVSVTFDLIEMLYHVNCRLIGTPAEAKEYNDSCNFLKAYGVKVLTIPENQKEADSQEITLYSSSFLVRSVLFYTDAGRIVLGPFCSVSLKQSDGKKLLEKNDVRKMPVAVFLHFFNLLPVISEETALRIAESVRSVLSETRTVSYVRKVDLAGSEDEEQEESVRTGIQTIEKRYFYEQSFMSDVRDGNARKAILNLHNMESDVRYLKRIGTTLENEKNGASIARTTLRLAAVQAGLPAFVIDQVAAKYASKIRNERSVDAILQLKEAMVRDMCREVLAFRQHRYSQNVQTLLYIFRHQYYKELSLGMIADEIGISKAYLITKFREETGVTPWKYLTDVRLAHAAAYLRGSRKTVQEIAQMVGIDDANYFTKLFRKKYGCSPVTYRENGETPQNT